MGRVGLLVLVLFTWNLEAQSWIYRTPTPTRPYRPPTPTPYVPPQITPTPIPITPTPTPTPTRTPTAPPTPVVIVGPNETWKVMVSIKSGEVFVPVGTWEFTMAPDKTCTANLEQNCVVRMVRK